MHTIRYVWLFEKRGKLLITMCVEDLFHNPQCVISCQKLRYHGLSILLGATGHTRLQRITQSDREDMKKREKDARRQQDTEEDRERMTWIKYTLGLKHQVSGCDLREILPKHRELYCSSTVALFATQFFEFFLFSFSYVKSHEFLKLAQGQFLTRQGKHREFVNRI